MSIHSACNCCNLQTPPLVVAAVTINESEKTPSCGRTFFDAMQFIKFGGGKYSRTPAWYENPFTYPPTTGKDPETGEWDIPDGAVFLPEPGHYYCDPESFANISVNEDVTWDLEILDFNPYTTVSQSQKGSIFGTKHLGARSPGEHSYYDNGQLREWCQQFPADCESKNHYAETKWVGNPENLMYYSDIHGIKDITWPADCGEPSYVCSGTGTLVSGGKTYGMCPYPDVPEWILNSGSADPSGYYAPAEENRVIRAISLTNQIRTLLPMWKNTDFPEINPDYIGIPSQKELLTDFNFQENINVLYREGIGGILGDTIVYNITDPSINVTGHYSSDSRISKNKAKVYVKVGWHGLNMPPTCFCKVWLALARRPLIHKSCWTTPAEGQDCSYLGEENSSFPQWGQINCDETWEYGAWSYDVIEMTQTQTPETSNGMCVDVESRREGLTKSYYSEHSGRKDYFLFESEVIPNVNEEISVFVAKHSFVKDFVPPDPVFENGRIKENCHFGGYPYGPNPPEGCGS